MVISGNPYLDKVSFSLLEALKSNFRKSKTPFYHHFPNFLRLPVELVLGDDLSETRVIAKTIYCKMYKELGIFFRLQDVK